MRVADHRRMALLGAVVVAALLIVGVALALAKSQRDARRTLEQRFAGSAGTAAALVETIIGQAYTSDAELARRRLATPAIGQAALRDVAQRTGASALFVLDARGRVVARQPRGARPMPGPDDHRRAALAGRPAISGPLGDPRRPAVEVAVPYPGAGGRRVLVVASPPGQVQAVLGPYLRRIPGSGDRRAAIIDRRHGNVTLADSNPSLGADGALVSALRSDPASTSGSYADGERWFSAVAVRKSPWSVVRTAQTSDLFSPVSGASRWLPWALLAVLAAAGAMIAVLAGRSAEAARRARQASEAKSAFLASMSHELRTPMTTVMGFSEMLAKGRLGELSDRQREVVGHIATSSQHLNQLIGEVLDLARVEEGRMAFEPEDVAPHELVLQVTDSMRGLAQDREIELAVDAPDIGTRRLDPARFKQVLYNLVGNAIKFTEAGGRVEVRLWAQAGGELGLQVNDTGMGIAAEDLDRIFLPFEQGARNNGGAGLGLAISQRIVDAQGGRISVRSRPGDGSTFEVRLPASVG